MLAIVLCQNKTICNNDRNIMFPNILYTLNISLMNMYIVLETNVFCTYKAISVISNLDRKSGHLCHNIHHYVLMTYNF